MLLYVWTLSILHLWNRSLSTGFVIKRKLSKWRAIYYLDDLHVIMASLHKYWGVKYRIRRQQEFLDNQEAVASARKMLDQREQFESSFSPENSRLAICSTCPETDCGLRSAHGIQNVYEWSIIKFSCPHHGEYKVDISDDHEITRLQFSTPLRHLLRAMIFASDEKLDWVCITGANYAGYYQEQLLWCHIPQAD
jgi:hypothetical protein